MRTKPRSPHLIALNGGSIDAPEHEKRLELLRQKVALASTDPTFAGMLDAMLDIRPRRTWPEIQDVAFCTGSEDVVLLRIDDDWISSDRYIIDLRTN